MKYTHKMQIIQIISIIDEKLEDVSIFSAKISNYFIVIDGLNEHLVL